MLSNKIRILDGSLATTLEQMGHIIDGDPLWTARHLLPDFDSISKVHSTFISAGAGIITTGSYQASIPSFKKHLGVSKEAAFRLIKRSTFLALEAIKYAKTDDEILVAGSIGPYGACQADGSEYSGSYMLHMSQQDLMDWHQPRMEALISSGVDLLALETFPSLDEALAVLKLLKSYPQSKAWVTFSCKDGDSTNFGDSFRTAVKACYDENPHQLVGVGINCTHPAFLTPLLRKAEGGVPGHLLPRVIYPNSGEVWTTQKGWQGDAASFLDIVKRDLKTWKTLGVKVIGGCCRITPPSIKALKDIVDSSE